MRRIRITVAYDGTEYHGWQVQPGLETIQGWLEKVTAEIEGAPVDVHGSGRTDAGVHAVGQVAAFTLANPIPCENLRKAMNRLLPKAIRVMRVEEAAVEFHPRFQAKAKTYEYRLWREEICPPMRRLYVCHHPYPLDEQAMMDLAGLYAGEHDFTAFAASDEKDELGGSKVRCVIESRLWREGAELVFRVRGSGFLKHMVRMMTGTLVEAGKGNLGREEFLKRLEPGYPGKAGPAMPAAGLCLLSVEY
jgi:tRNA pseudouridine38-40 synthase